MTTSDNSFLEVKASRHSDGRRASQHRLTATTDLVRYFGKHFPRFFSHINNCCLRLYSSCRVQGQTAVSASPSTSCAVVSATVTYNNITAAASAAAAAAAAASTSYAAVRGYKGERPTAMLPLISIR